MLIEIFNLKKERSERATYEKDKTDRKEPFLMTSWTLHINLQTQGCVY